MEIDNTTKKLLSDPDKRWAWIKYQLQLQGRTLAQVARDNGVTRQCIYHVSWAKYPRMEKVIADALGVEPKDLFPDRYCQETGLPVVGRGNYPRRKKTRRSKDSTRSRRRNVDGTATNECRDAA